MLKRLTALLVLLASTPVLAQERSEVVSATTLATDSLIAIDEDVLVESLARLVQARQEYMRETNKANIDGILELLRLEMLFDLFGNRVPQSVATSIPQANSSPDLEARLLALEHRLALLAPQLYRERALDAPQSYALESMQDTLGHDRLARIEQRLASLLDNERSRSHQATSDKALDYLLSLLAPNAMPQVDAGVDSLAIQGQPIHVERVVADFKRSIFFPVGKTTLDARARAELNEVVEFLKTYPTARVSISGYASPEGSRKVNERLSRGRLQAVMLYLDKEGVSPDNFVAAHTGVDDNTLAHPLSRRVDVMLYR